MSDTINRADVTVNLRDVHGQFINDEVEMTFYNRKAHSFSQNFPVKFKGGPVILQGVPAFPVGLAEVVIKPKKYRHKIIIINVFGGQPNIINEDLFIDPDNVRATLMDFQDLQGKPYGLDLLRILQSSGINKAAWDKLDKRNRATIMNLCAKMHKETTKDGQTLISRVNTIDKGLLDKKHRARIFSNVNSVLLNAVRKSPDRFKKVSGSLHKFQGGWTPVSEDNSFKTPDAAGNIQLTFATNAAGEFRADIDLDDHQGIKHAADVLKHKIERKDTDPYDIHQILVYFQQLDPGYRLG